MWLARLKDAGDGDKEKVYALKILRKVDGMRCSGSMLVSVGQAASKADTPSDPAEAGRACAQRAERAGRRRRSPLYHDHASELPGPGLTLYAGM